MNLLPHPAYDSLLDVAKRLSTKPVQLDGIFFRAVGPKYATPNDIVSGTGAQLGGGRWTPPGFFRAVYASESPETATSECLAHNRYFHIPDYDALPRVIVAIQVRLGQVLVLNDARVRRAIGISLTKLLAEDWRREQDAGREALTQAIGRAAFDAGFDGMLAPSHARNGGVNLVAFSDRLTPTHTLEVLHPEALDILRQPNKK